MAAESKGNALGGVAILSWGTLGSLGAVSAGMPPYLLLGSCFAIAAALGLAFALATGVRIAPLHAPGVIVAASLLSAYHVVYFSAFHHAEAIPVSLINYLWPAWLIIIGNLFFRMDSGWPGYFGAAIGFLGVAVLIGDRLDLRLADLLGYALAMAGAILWATYSNIRRVANHQGMGTMVSICILSALICLAVGLVKGEVFSPSGRDLLVIVLLGIGPAGGAFFAWDYAMRHGNAPLLGVLGYGAPLLSTCLMVLLGLGEPSWRIAIALAMITLGGAIVHINRRTPKRGAA